MVLGLVLGRSRLLLLPWSPTVRVDAVEYVAGVVVDGAQGPDDPKTLIASRLDPKRTLVESPIDEYPTRLQECRKSNKLTSLRQFTNLRQISITHRRRVKRSYNCVANC